MKKWIRINEGVIDLISEVKRADCIEISVEGIDDWYKGIILGKYIYQDGLILNPDYEEPITEI